MLETLVTWAPGFPPAAHQTCFMRGYLEVGCSFEEVSARDPALQGWDNLIPPNQSDPIRKTVYPHKPPNWLCSQIHGQDWVKNSRSVCLFVPSISSPLDERGNVVMNTLHPHYANWFAGTQRRRS